MNRMALALGLLAVAGWVWQREWTAVLQPDPPVLLDIRDDIRTVEDLAQWPGAHGTFENDGFVPCLEGSFSEAGWCLPPGRQGALRLVLPELPQARGLLARVFFFRKQPEATSRLAVYREGDPAARMVFDNVHFADARLDLSPALSGPGGRVVLSFEGDNPTSRPDVFVQYFEIRAVAVPLPVLPALPLATAAFLSVGLCLLPLVSWRRLLPLWGVLGLGFALRYEALSRVFLLPLDWDALGFVELAQRMAPFTDAGFYTAQFGIREPLFVLMVKVWLGLLGHSETHVRLLSFLGSLGAIAMTYRLGRTLFGVRLGWLGALVVAVSLPLVRESVRGLRLEWELILLMFFFEIAFLKAVRSHWLRAGLAGCLAGFLSLLRVSYLVGLIPLLVMAFWPRSWRGLAVMGLAVSLLLGLHAPHRWNGYQRYGAWFWDVRADWWANVEFAGREGWRSKVDVWRNTQGDSRYMTMTEYLFGLHTVPEVIAGYGRGLWKLSRRMDVVAFPRAIHRLTGIQVGWVDGAFQALGFFGLFVGLFRRQWRWMLLVYLILVLPWAFVYDRGGAEPWRHTYHAFPLVVFGVLAAFSWLSRLRQPEWRARLHRAVAIP